MYRTLGLLCLSFQTQAAVTCDKDNPRPIVASGVVLLKTAGESHTIVLGYSAQNLSQPFIDRVKNTDKKGSEVAARALREYTARGYDLPAEYISKRPHVCSDVNGQNTVQLYIHLDDDISMDQLKNHYADLYANPVTEWNFKKIQGFKEISLENTLDACKALRERDFPSFADAPHLYQMAVFDRQTNKTGKEKTIIQPDFLLRICQNLSAFKDAFSKSTGKYYE